MYTPQGKHTKLLYNEVRFCRAKKCANQRKNIKGTLKFRLLDRWVHTQKIIYWQQQQQAKKKYIENIHSFFYSVKYFLELSLSSLLGLWCVCVCVCRNWQEASNNILWIFFCFYFFYEHISIVVMGWY